MRRSGKAWSRDEVEALHRDYMSGNVRDVIRRHDVSRCYMYVLFKAHGLASRRELGIGLPSMANVSRTELDAAYSEYSKGDARVCDIAARFGVTAATLYKTFRRCGYAVPLRNGHEERSRIHKRYPRGRARSPMISEAQAQELFMLIKRPGQSLSSVARSAYISVWSLRNAFTRCGLDWRPYIKHGKV